jgi:hypothetical protein
MSAYLIVEHIITDAAKFEQYRTAVGPMIAKHGGRYPTYQPFIAPRKACTSDLDMLITLEGA